MTTTSPTAHDSQRDPHSGPQRADAGRDRTAPALGLHFLPHRDPRKAPSQMFGNRPFREHCCFPSPRGDTRCPQVAPLAVFSARNPLRHPHRRGRRAGGAGGAARYVALGDSTAPPPGSRPGRVGAASVPALDPQLPARDRERDRCAAGGRHVRCGGDRRLLRLAVLRRRPAARRREGGHRSS